MAESLLLSLAGAALGVVLALSVGGVINLLLNRLSATRGVTETFSLFSTPLWMIATTLLAAALIGYLVAYLPARRASQIEPMDALRRE